MDGRMLMSYQSGLTADCGICSGFNVGLKGGVDLHASDLKVARESDGKFQE